MTITAAELEKLISDVRGACQHLEATRWRVDTVAAGSVAPTIGSDFESRVFAFGPNLATAAYLAKVNRTNVDQLRQELARFTLPTPAEFELSAAEARKVPDSTGFLSFFRKRPVAGEQAIAWMQSIDVPTVHAILSGIDAALGSTPTNEFTGLNLSAAKESITRDLMQLTNQPVEWVTAEDVSTHIAAAERIKTQHATERMLEQRVEEAARQLCEQQAQEEIQRTDISVLDQITDGRLRLGPLQHLSLNQIAHAAPADLTPYEGVGEKTATQAIAAARSFIDDVKQSQIPRIDYQKKHASTQYVTALANLLSFREDIRDLPKDVLQLQPVASEDMVAIAGSNHLLTEVEAYRPVPNHSAEQAWNLYAIRAAEFHAYGDTEQAGDVPEEVARRIEDINLQGTIKANLRGYQAFGAKFALAQRKVLIGDEMGLGKTLQALAAIVHLAAQGKKHALVVCPPSLRINWEREIRKFTELEPFILHGATKEAVYEAWTKRGGVAIAGFPEVRENEQLTGRDSERPVDVLVVDEAHRAKNPKSLQSQGVQALTNRAETCIYLTGTPLENRVAEFEALLGYLNPTITAELERVRGRAGKFKKSVAHIYLRRNQSDVLSELPPLVEVEEWIEPKPEDIETYENAVQRGHFMDMRQAFSGPRSAKMERITELLDDGADGAKTIIFTYFRSVLDGLVEHLGDRAFGPIAGGISHQERQKAVDDFTAASPGAVLVCQITAASEGLNIQAASRVVIFEPQLNPAVEAQAVARAHRMGQIRTVEVHRLLTPASVEEQLTAMLADKRALFERYARESEAAEINPEAMDISEAQLIKDVIAAERERIGEPDRL
ncbi:DEAD/DEAH box helicase [Corynebacterium resistens]|uniref:DEAD/DEAH box helicase n=1 Tax=Corynebacterium resistens TaxID=258224 RepID=UPI0023520CC7|nr:DEAD/DEAH box helicase [Corynebacterium resistens]